MKQPGFNLKKWYLDCVTEEGVAIIIYTALLKWGKLEIPYTSLIFSPPGQVTTTKTRYSSKYFPLRDSDKITWENTRIGSKGVWLADSNEISQILHKNERGKLTWNCFQPRSKVEIEWEGNLYSGYGYAEMLELDMPPWDLDMSRLRWGRYTAANDSVIWIEIEGRYTSQWSWLNGTRSEVSLISDNKIEIKNPSVKLEINQKRIIESEKKIFKTAKGLLKFIPGITQVIPREFLNSDEVKWCSRGHLFLENNQGSEGWLIHERVDFKL